MKRQNKIVKGMTSIMFSKGNNGQTSPSRKIKPQLLSKLTEILQELTWKNPWAMCLIVFREFNHSKKVIHRNCMRLKSFTRGQIGLPTQ